MTYDDGNVLGFTEEDLCSNELLNNIKISVEL